MLGYDGELAVRIVPLHPCSFSAGRLHSWLCCTHTTPRPPICNLHLLSLHHHRRLPAPVLVVSQPHDVSCVVPARRVCATARSPTPVGFGFGQCRPLQHRPSGKNLRSLHDTLHHLRPPHARRQRLRCDHFSRSITSSASATQRPRRHQRFSPAEHVRSRGLSHRLFAPCQHRCAPTTNNCRVRPPTVQPSTLAAFVAVAASNC